jgi:hypothetical protein
MCHAAQKLRFQRLPDLLYGRWSADVSVNHTWRGEGRWSSRPCRYESEEELMNDLPFDTLTRHAARRASRRASLMTLGKAGLAALASPLSTVAKKKRAGKKAKQKCQRQVGQCTTFLLPLCGEDPDCLTFAQQCCALTGNCDPVGFINCVSPA